ncbi:hypothetical protein [Poriferisphaera sp. WC338]|uniref:hypothetical protein n=1 Tax=Poriferisphaera sp. WC338 TaxID=3425129 RepID=UPI003D812A63
MSEKSTFGSDVPPLPSDAAVLSESLGEDKSDGTKPFSCGGCGSELHYEPGTDHLACPYCGHQNTIELAGEAIEELDYHAMLNEIAASEQTVEMEFVRCNGCGARVDRPEHLDAFDCPFCGDHLVVAGEKTRIIKPKSLLPFLFKQKEARGSFEQWIKGLWFAPNKLKQYARADDAFKGVYLPHWTYDSDTITEYTGQRGEDYWTTESYTTMENGKSVRKTRRVKKIRWYPASGTVYVPFNDVLVVASKSLPEKYVHELEPWDLDQLVSYQDEFVKGFVSECYQVDLPSGFERAKELMEPNIRSAIRSDIGGDHQRISWTHSQYNDITFKHVLLPVWMSAYRYNEKVYRVVVNARTGEVQGERPWSWVKITLAVLVTLAIAGGIFLMFQS